MAKTPSKNGKGTGEVPASPKVSRLGQRLRELSDKALASGTDTLSNEQIHRLISEIRGKPA